MRPGQIAPGPRDRSAVYLAIVATFGKLRKETINDLDDVFHGWTFLISRPSNVVNGDVSQRFCHAELFPLGNHHTAAADREAS
jgi:hypothetical protein